MIAAVAVNGTRISSTLGKSTGFILLDQNSMEQISCQEKIPIFLKKHNVELLICNGIGNCMLDLLSAMKIKVIPGVDLELDEVIRDFRSGTLKAGKKYSCTDHGQSCGACAGTF